MATSFLRETKQREKEECCAGVDPATHFDCNGICLVASPNKRRYLEDYPELVVRVCPRLVRRNRDTAGVDVDAESAERKRQGYL